MPNDLNSTRPNQPGDTNSMSSILLAPLDELQSLLGTLLQSSAPPQSKPPPPPPIEAFLACDDALAAAVQLSYTHQIRQRKIEELKNEILELDAKWRSICRDLEEGRQELRAIVKEGEVRINAIEDAKKAALPYPELLAYAQSLSAFTSAPPNMPDMSIPGQPPPSLFFPPFPNEEKMRRGHLNAEAPLGMLGETHLVGRPPTVSPKMGDFPMPGANPYRQDERPHQALFDLDLDLDLNPDL